MPILLKQLFESIMITIFYFCYQLFFVHLLAFLSQFLEKINLLYKTLEIPKTCVLERTI
jgi:hypothetical protein